MSETTPEPTAAPVLPEKPVLPQKPQGSRLPLIIGAVVVALALIAGGIYLFTQRQSPAVAGKTVVKLGTTEAAQPHWQILKDLAAKENIDLQIVNFAEYPLPNPALADGEIDLNSFQHVLYLADHNNNTGDNLQPIGSTIIVPLPLYSEKYTSLEQFTKGDQVAIPNDATNQARALFVLQAAKLITFTGDPKVPTPDDVDTAASTVVVRPVEASQTASLIKDRDIAGVVVNNNFATDAGFDLSSALYADDPASPGAQPYINIFAAQADQVDNPTYQRIVELYHDKSVTDSVVASSGGTAVIVEGYDGPKLREVLAQTQTNLKG